MGKSREQQKNKTLAIKKQREFKEKQFVEEKKPKPKEKVKWVPRSERIVE